MKTLLLSLLVAVPIVALAGLARPELQWVQPVSLASGQIANPGTEPKVQLLGVATAPGASRVRVILRAPALSGASRVRFTSLKDEQSQTLDAAQLAEWSLMSALFNGESVRVEVLVAPGDADVSVEVKGLWAFSHFTDGGKAAESCCGDAPNTLCGVDDRVAAGDNRVGRLNSSCTAWLVSNGAVLTAGHCGVAGVFEVNIPASAANGAIVASAVADQFPVVAGSASQISGGVGNDWAVFRIGLNSNLQSAHTLYGFFRMTRELPGGGTTLRVTGCGIDNSPVGSQPGVCGNFDSMGNCTHFGLNAQNQTLQTATGAFNSIAGTTLRYAVDTEPANSGSPVIWGGFTIGIHTAGGCAVTSGANNGTAFSLVALENAIAAVPGQTLTPIIARENIRYLDLVPAPNGVENGTVFNPHNTIAEAVTAVPANGQISIVAGSYPVPANTTITKAMTLSAPAGAATLGN